MPAIERMTALDKRRRPLRPSSTRLQRGTTRRRRTARYLAAISLHLLAAPLYAQGAGPPDLGAAGYVILGMWLFFWIGVFVYPIALVIYFIRRQSNARAEEQDDDLRVPSLEAAMLRGSVIAHVVLTLAALILFVFG